MEELTALMEEERQESCPQETQEELDDAPQTLASLISLGAKKFLTYHYIWRTSLALLYTTHPDINLETFNRYASPFVCPTMTYGPLYLGHSFPPIS